MTASRATRVGLVLALGGPPLFVLLSRLAVGDIPGVATAFVVQLIYCAMAASVILIVTRGEGLPLSSIGVRRPNRTTFGSGILLALATVYVLPLVTTPLVDAIGFGGFEAGLRALTPLPPWLRVFIGATGGAVEETLYRGYAIERLTTITGRRWLAALIAVSAFAMAHLPWWGLGPALAADLPFGVMMTVFYLWRRDLLANIIGHSAALVVSLLAI